ncbi:hypothetical protein AF72_03455 [Xylella taiwanensis]|uniref:Uncharacterized protein n=1 Tax=Xylella taiwanensis TaxID=1444770 RepID=Z9JL83_9GAMM|nr:hypothetical protein AF72_03455 [Xylella taiwanensis]
MKKVLKSLGRRTYIQELVVLRVQSFACAAKLLLAAGSANCRCTGAVADGRGPY